MIKIDAKKIEIPTNKKLNRNPKSKLQLNDNYFDINIDMTLTSLTHLKKSLQKLQLIFLLQ